MEVSGPSDCARTTDAATDISNITAIILLIIYNVALREKPTVL